MKFLCDNVVYELEKEIERKMETGIKPSLYIIQVGDNQASNVYINRKIECCKKFNIESKLIKLPENINETDLLNEIDSLNNDDKCKSFIVQLPLPKHINERVVLDAIDPSKDADALTSYRLGELMNGSSDIAPCTSKGVMDIINNYDKDHLIKIKNMLIINRSNIVGKPLVPLALNQNLTVNIAHSHTPKELLYNLMAQADVIVTATGVKDFINKETVDEIFRRTNDEKFIVDVSIIPEGKFIYGDVSRDLYDENETRIITTPVPKGVGRLTVLNLILNSIKLTEKQNN